jgi:hypothetical protein
MLGPDHVEFVPAAIGVGMTSDIESLTEKIRNLEAELEAKLAQRGPSFTSAWKKEGFSSKQRFCAGIAN